MSVRRPVFGAAVGLLVLATPVQSFAGCEIPFLVTTGSSLNGATDLQCLGPWFRSSPDIELQTSQNQAQFYCADTDVVFPAHGLWDCGLNEYTLQTSFCVEDDGPVLVTVTGQTPPTVTSVAGVRYPAPVCNIGEPCSCPKNAVESYIGNPGGGKAAAASIETVGDGDVDTFIWRGRGGAPLTVTLDVDRSAGGKGREAILRVVDASGHVIGVDTGPLPLKVKGSVPASGTFRIIVTEARGDEAFRGNYRLVAEALGIRRGRSLEPQQNVEGPVP